MSDNDVNLTIVFQPADGAASGSGVSEPAGMQGSVRDLLLSLMRGVQSYPYGGSRMFPYGGARPYPYNNGMQQFSYNGMLPFGYEDASPFGFENMSPFGREGFNRYRYADMRSHHAHEHDGCGNVKRSGSYPAWLPRPVREAMAMADRHAAAKEKYDCLVDKVAGQEHVPEELLEAMITAGSGYDPHMRSDKGEGLMRVMPEIARRYGIEDLCDPEQNLRAGAKYLGDLLKKFDGNEALAVAAYYMGEDCAERYKTNPSARRFVGHVMALRQLYMPVQALIESGNRRTAVL